jgi:cation diffusion facilitator family transporter
MTVERRARTIARASWIGIAGNAVLAAAKLLVGFTAHSLAVVGDGVDSAIDILTSAISLVAARIMAKPPDTNHPYGHARAETIATKALSFVIFFAGAQLAVSTITQLVQGVERELPGMLTIYVTIASIVGKSGLAAYKFWVGRKTSSPLLIADAKNMRSDIAVSLGVLLGLAFTFWLELSILDVITALLISLWIMYVAFRIFLETNAELMEGYQDTQTYQQIFDAVSSVPGAENPHRTRIRTIGSLCIVDLDIEVDGTLTVREAHEVAKKTESAIRHAVPHVYDVLVHVEPIGNVEKTERYGLSQNTLDAESGK